MAYLNNDLKNRNILVTGANGFIGSHLIEELINLGADVTAMVKDNLVRIAHLNEKIRIIKDDLSLQNSLAIENGEIIFHLAALTDIKKCLKDPISAYNANVLGTINLLQKCRNIRKFVYISTLGVYGEPKHFPVSENDPALPIEPYAASKLAAESFVYSFCTSRNIPFSIARLFNVYGPRQRENFIIPSIILKAIKNEEILLKNLNSTRDFIYVKDAVNALIMLPMKGENEIYNIGTGKETSIEELVKIIEKLIKHEISIKIAQKKESANVQRSVADINKMREKIGWVPVISLGEGIKRTIEYYKDGI